MVRLEEPLDADVPETLPGLPENYNFELPKTIRTIRRLGATRLLLQFPDGLLAYAPLLADFFLQQTSATSTILGDVVYGACCVDDRSLAADLLIHYGHSCLIPITETRLRVLYIFVDVRFDLDHLRRLILSRFTGRIALIGTIQFNSSVHRLKRLIDACNPRACSSTQPEDSENNGNEENALPALEVVIPQARPLSAGEVLGCTSPVISDAQKVVYIGDGRFHLESAMIRNPTLEFYKYCPFTRRMTREHYDFDRMLATRTAAIAQFRSAARIGVILGMLGRQGSRRILTQLTQRIRAAGQQVFVIAADEISATTLYKYTFIDAFVQISCPRLSIDWGACYRKPLLSPFEVFYNGGTYEMDYYARGTNQPWQNYQ